MYFHNTGYTSLNIKLGWFYMRATMCILRLHTQTPFNIMCNTEVLVCVYTKRIERQMIKIILKAQIKTITWIRLTISLSKPPISLECWFIKLFVHFVLNLYSCDDRSNKLSIFYVKLSFLPWLERRRKTRI